MGRFSTRLLDRPLKNLRRLVFLIAGGSVLLVGVALIVLPGPAFVVIPLGLGILGVEFAWARRLLREGRRRAEAMGDEVLGRLRRWGRPAGPPRGRAP